MNEYDKKEAYSDGLEDPHTDRVFWPFSKVGRKYP